MPNVNWQLSVAFEKLSLKYIDGVAAVNMFIHEVGDHGFETLHIQWAEQLILLANFG